MITKVCWLCALQGTSHQRKAILTGAMGKESPSWCEGDFRNNVPTFLSPKAMENITRRSWIS